MNIFDILGPVMVGPSSSHTAGAVRIGKVTMKLLGSIPKRANIYLHGSFAATGVGHGTDKALLAGLLGMEPDDIRIPDSETIANKEGMKFHFAQRHIRSAHPNTAYLEVSDENGKQLNIQASSLGGGRIFIDKIDGITVNVSAEHPTLVVHNEDEPGHVAAVTAALAKEQINIATLALNRSKRGGDAVLVAETDVDIPLTVVKTIEQFPGIRKVTYLNMQS